MSPALRRLSIFHFRQRLARPIPTIMGPVTCRPALLLRIEDSDGAHGWGEIWCNFPPDGDLHRKRLAANILPAALAEADLSGGVFAALETRFRSLALQAGEPGPLAQVAAGADIALCDLAARRAGVPLAEWLGGERHAVPAYASGLSPDIWQDQLARMRDRGFAHFKLRIGFGAGDGLPVARELLAVLRAGETLRVDANQAWDIGTALARVPELEGMGLRWLEEPLPADAPPDHWRRLSAATATPLAAGENLRSRAAFLRMIDTGAVRVVQPDICKWGGLSGGAEIARAARAAGRLYCPHYLGGGVGLMASAHLLSAVGGDGLLEVDSSDNILGAALAAHDGRLTDGLFSLPGEPGLGYDPDLGCVSDLRVDHIGIDIGRG